MEGEDDEEDQQPQIEAANDQIALALAARFDDAQENRIRWKKPPKIVANP